MGLMQRVGLRVSHGCFLNEKARKLQNTIPPSLDRASGRRIGRLGGEYHKSTMPSQG